MAAPYTYIRAPHPGHKVTMVLPSPELGDSLSSQNQVLVKRSMLGRVITYVKSSNKSILVLPFKLTRMKALEVEAFFRVYYRAPLQIETEYDGALYTGSLFGALERVATSRYKNDEETIELTMRFLVERVT